MWGTLVSPFTSPGLLSPGQPKGHASGHDFSRASAPGRLVWMPRTGEGPKDSGLILVNDSLILNLIFHAPDFGMEGWTNTVQPSKKFHARPEPEMGQWDTILPGEGTRPTTTPQ
jgi:hypothetical protein